LEQHVIAWITQYGYLAIFLLLVFGIVGLPVPDETLLTFTGYLIYTGHLRFPLAYATALAGSGSGITISYWLGRTFGMMAIHRYGRWLRIREEHVRKAQKFFEGAGHWGLTFGYFVPGVRHLTAFSAGMSGLKPHFFAIFAYAGACTWVATFMTLGYFLGERWHEVERSVHGWISRGVIASAIVLAAYVAWRVWRRKRSR